MKKSAGILVYKKEDNEIKVLLCHFGGPYWQNIDKGAWSIPKGETNTPEKLIDTAKRELSEETNLVLTDNPKYLASKKISNNKLVIMYYTEKDFDLTNCKSNTFTKEYPANSGIIQTFPEMDKYEWMELKRAKEMIIKNQLFFINRLETVLLSKK